MRFPNGRQKGPSVTVEKLPINRLNDKILHGIHGFHINFHGKCLEQFTLQLGKFQIEIKLKIFISFKF